MDPPLAENSTSYLPSVLYPSISVLTSLPNTSKTFSVTKPLRSLLPLKLEEQMSVARFLANDVEAITGLYRLVLIDSKGRVESRSTPRIDDDTVVIEKRESAGGSRVGGWISDHDDSPHVVPTVVHDITLDAGPGVRQTAKNIHSSNTLHILITISLNCFILILLC